MNRLIACGLLVACGCVPVGGRLSVTDPSPEDMNRLRQHCSEGLSDDEILDSVLYADGAWELGVSYDEFLRENETGCEFDFDCVACWDAIAYFVYVKAH